MNPRNALVEFIGTFFLVLVIGLCVLKPNDAGAMAPLAIGSVLMVVVYLGGPLSGGHYNPAVTLGVFLRGKCSSGDVLPYMLAQCAAGVLAGYTVIHLKGAPATPGIPDVGKSLLNEFLFTFLLVSTVLNVATSKKSAGNSYFGLAIGFAVLAGAYAGGAISGGAYNPAVACGISTMGLSAWPNIWIFFVANLAAGAVAAAVYKIVNPDEI